MTEQGQDWHLRRPLRLTVDEFFRMAEAGAFVRFTRTELIDGEVLTMNAQWVLHSRITTDLSVELLAMVEELGLDLVVLGGPSVSIEPDSAPEPDIVVAAIDRSINAPVPAAAVRLAVEVSASTLDFDLGRKAELYAGAALPEYWVIDVRNRLVRQFWAPDGAAYTRRRETPFGQPVAAETIDGLIVPTTRLC